MADSLSRSSLSSNQFRRLSSFSSLTRASQNSDDTLETARSIGSLSASSSPVSFRIKGNLSRSDRDDFVKLEIAPGAAYSSISNEVNIKGANVRLLTFFEFPGSPPQQATTLRYRTGKSTQVTNSPFANSFGVPLQLYLQLKSLSPSKRVSYNFKVTFNP